MKDLLDFLVGLVEGVAAEGDELLGAFELGSELIDAHFARFYLADDVVKLADGFFVGHGGGVFCGVDGFNGVDGKEG